jgi:steroid delta-isomerase-like uncharacterized protein
MMETKSRDAAGLEERNKLVAERLYREVFERGDLDVADELVHRDCRDLHDPQDRRGPERVRETASMLRAAFPDQRWDIGQLVADGEHVVMYSTWTGTHEGTFMGIPPTAKRVSVHHMYLFRILDRKITEYAAVRDDLEMMRQLGLLHSRG